MGFVQSDHVIQNVSADALFPTLHNIILSKNLE